MRLNKTYAKRAWRGCLPKNAVPKERANSRRKCVAILKSWSDKSPILRPLYWLRECADVSALCCIHALWKKQCKKKGARDRERSAVQLSNRSTPLDAPL
jgi:hypothetical protein